jgi:flagellar biosynthesis/type III secretory pathway protein FliH
MLSDIDTHKVFYDKVKFVYLEMPKFTKEVDELKTHFEKWMYVLKNLKRLDNLPDKLRESIFEKMFTAAEVAKLTPEEYRSYVDNLNSYRDIKNCMDYAKKEGEAKGLAKGLAKGEAKGLAKGEARGLAKGLAEGEHERLKLQQEIERLKKLLTHR